MKNFFFISLWSAIIMLATSSCIVQDEPDFSTEVIRIENSSLLVSEGNDNWSCREALICVDDYPWHVSFPVQYEGEIVEGTMVEYQCHKTTAYYKDGKRIIIDWPGTKKSLEI